MAKNIKVTLVHQGAPDEMKRAAARVIDGSLLHAVDLGGRYEEAKSRYNKMVGIKSTTHEYEIVETDEPVYVPPELYKSTAGDLQQQQEDRIMGRMASMLSQGIAEGVAKALVAMRENDKMGATSRVVEESSSSSSSSSSEATAETADTMRVPARTKRPTL